MRVNIDRLRGHVEALARFTSTPGAGATRLSYSPEFRQASDYVGERARRLGLSVRYDAVGNLRMRLGGTEKEAPIVLVGSHLDTVINGGDFDGVLGVVCGLEAVEVLIESGVTPRHPVEVISFIEEEGTSFRCPLAGSKAVAGVLGVEDLKTLRDDRSQSLYDAARAFGLDPDRLPDDQLRPGGVKAMLELHIEQGSVLESEGLAVGIVERIAGSENQRARLTGRADHAGTTPMPLRRDALAGAAEIVLAVERLAREPERPETVATVGRIQCLPNAANVVPGEVTFSIDVRDVEVSRLESAGSASRDAASLIAAERDLHCEIEVTGTSAPVPMSADIVALLVTVAERMELACRTMNSGALHDAAMMARIAEAGMIFVPSRDGRSHSPCEWTDYADTEHGANLLLRMILELAGAR